jgi:hypothetical protein
VHDCAVRGEDVDFATGVHESASRGDLVDVGSGAIATGSQDLLDGGAREREGEEKCNEECRSDVHGELPGLKLN